MDWSIFFAKFLGLYLLIITAIWLIRKDPFETEVRDVLQSKGIFALSGAMQIIIGLIIVILHPSWTADWRSLITLLGYFAIIQGIIRLAFPVEARRFFLRSLDKAHWVWLLVAGALGLILTYNGFSS